MLHDRFCRATWRCFYLSALVFATYDAMHWRTRLISQHRPFVKGLQVASLSCAILVAPLSSHSTAVGDKKTINLPDAEIVRIVTDDLTLRQALNTADFTRSIYSDNCQFQDEIDVYSINDYVRGTKALFDATESHTELLEPVKLESNGEAIIAKFRETLSFKLPFIHPKVDLSGRLRLELNQDRLISFSREYWDQSIPEVLSTIHL